MRFQGSGALWLDIKIRVYAPTQEWNGCGAFGMMSPCESTTSPRSRMQVVSPIWKTGKVSQENFTAYASVPHPATSSPIPAHRRGAARCE